MMNYRIQHTFSARTTGRVELVAATSGSVIRVVGLQITSAATPTSAKLESFDGDETYTQLTGLFEIPAPAGALNVFWPIRMEGSFPGYVQTTSGEALYGNTTQGLAVFELWYVVVPTNINTSTSYAGGA